MAGLVLLVEDDPDIREDLQFLIEHRGYEVIAAENGEDALSKLEGKRAPCTIVLDLMMPVMDGWELCAELRKDERLAKVPVIVLSGATDVESQAENLSARGYLPKPIKIDRLFDLLACHC